MRVLFLTNGLAYGGAERIVEALALDVARRGHEVMVVATTRGGPIADTLRAAGIDVEVLAIRSPFDVDVVRRFVERARRFAPDIVHSHLAVSDICAAAARTFLPRARFHTTIHNAGVELGPGKRALWRLALRRLDHKSAVSQDVARRLELADVEVVRPSLVVPSAAPLARAEARARLGVRDDTPLVLGVGRLAPIKGFDVLADAARALRDPRARVLVIGAGPEDRTLRAQGLELVGPRDDAAALLGAADVVAVPSRSEGFPQVPLEAMAAGRAVVATRVGGTPEIVSHGETGLLVPPQAPDALGGAIDALLAAPERAAAMGAAGRAALAERQLTRAAMVDAYLERYAASLDAPATTEPPDAPREG